MLIQNFSTKLSEEIGTFMGTDTSFHFHPFCTRLNIENDHLKFFVCNRYIVSDCDSIQVLVDNHKYLGDTREDAVAQTLRAG